MSTTDNAGSSKQNASYHEQHAGQHAEQARKMQQQLNSDSDRGRRGHPNRSVRIHPDNDAAEFDYFYVEAVLTTRSGQDADAVAAALDGLFPGAYGRQDGQPIEGVTTFELPADTDVDAVCEELDNIRLGIAMPDHVIHVTPTGCCPATEPIPWDDGPVPAVASTPHDGRDVHAVVIDSGRDENVEKDHDWLKKPKITGTDEDSVSAGHYVGHGSFVCGVMRTMAPKVEIDMNALKFVAGAVLESDLAVELYKAVHDDKPAIISMSAGTTTRKGLPPVALSVVCESLPTAKILLIAAAGNDGGTDPFYPAYFSTQGNANVVSVGALNPDKSLASYSNRDWPSVYARGSSMVNGYPKNTAYVYQEPPRIDGPNGNFKKGFANWDGTSFATPLVAGLVAAQMTALGVTEAMPAWAVLAQKAQANTGPDGLPRLFPGDAD